MKTVLWFKKKKHKCSAAMTVFNNHCRDDQKSNNGAIASLLPFGSAHY